MLHLSTHSVAATPEGKVFKIAFLEAVTGFKVTHLDGTVPVIDMLYHVLQEPDYKTFKATYQEKNMLEGDFFLTYLRQSIIEHIANPPDFLPYPDFISIYLTLNNYHLRYAMWYNLHGAMSKPPYIEYTLYREAIISILQAIYNTTPNKPQEHIF